MGNIELPVMFAGGAIVGFLLGVVLITSAVDGVVHDRAAAHGCGAYEGEHFKWNDGHEKP